MGKSGSFLVSRFQKKKKKRIKPQKRQTGRDRGKKDQRETGTKNIFKWLSRRKKIV